MALTADVAAGGITASAWGNEIRNRSVQAFASTAERDAQWPTAPNGAICVVLTGTDAVLYHRRGGAWGSLHVPGIVADALVTIATGGLGITAGPITLSNGQLNDTYTPADRVWTHSNLVIAGTNNSTGSRITLITSGSPGFQFGAFGTTAAYLLDHNGTTLGTLNYTAVSEARFKREIEAWKVDVDKLLGLAVRQYRRPVAPAPDAPADEPEQLGPLEWGLIAEEVDEVAPELVVDHPNVGVRTVDRPSLTFWLLSAVQQLSARVAALEAAAR
jgi:hypothetical protein